MTGSAAVAEAGDITRTPEFQAALTAALARHGIRPDGIADLDRLGLTAEDLVSRRASIGGSDANIIAKAEPDHVEGLARDLTSRLARLNRLGRQKRGELVEAPSSTLNASAGHWMEPFILAQTERYLGRQITRRGERVYSRRNDWMHATLDGWLDEWEGQPWVVQAKFYSPWYRLENIVQDLAGQLTHEPYVADAAGTMLAVYNQGPRVHLFAVELDLHYLGLLYEEEARFWRAVQDGRDPVVFPVREPVAAKPVLVGEVDLSTDNVWVDAATTWRETRDAARRHREAIEALKLRAKSAGHRKAFGAGLTASVARNGACSIEPEESEQEDPAHA
jgi:hypothetical protein